MEGRGSWRANNEATAEAGARACNGRMEEEGRTNEEKVGLLPAPAITIVAVVVEGIAINP